MDPLALLLVPLVVAGSGLTAMELHARRSRDHRWQTVHLHFGRDVTPESVVAFLDAVAGLHRHASVLLDVRADHHGISHYLSSDQATLDTLRGTARALLPSLRFEPVNNDADVTYRSGRSVRLRGRLKILRSDGAAEASAGLLAALQPLGQNEHLLIRWTLQPGRAEQVPQTQDEHGRTLPSEHRRLLKLKNEGSVLRARVSWPSPRGTRSGPPTWSAESEPYCALAPRPTATYEPARDHPPRYVVISPAAHSSSPIATPPKSWPACCPGQSTRPCCRA